MDPQTQAVYEAVLALPEAERILLVERLLEDLGPEPDEMSDDEFAAELDRRHAEHQRDPSTGVPWSEMKFDS